MRTLSDKRWHSDYRTRHRSLTSTLTNDEHARFSALAARHGLAPTAYATQQIRKMIEPEKVKVA